MDNKFTKDEYWEWKKANNLRYKELYQRSDALFVLVPTIILVGVILLSVWLSIH